MDQCIPSWQYYLTVLTVCVELKGVFKMPIIIIIIIIIFKSMTS